MEDFQLGKLASRLYRFPFAHRVEHHCDASVFSIFLIFLYLAGRRGIHASLRACSVKVFSVIVFLMFFCDFEYVSHKKNRRKNAKKREEICRDRCPAHRSCGT